MEYRRKRTKILTPRQLSRLQVTTKSHPRAAILRHAAISLRGLAVAAMLALPWLADDGNGGTVAIYLKLGEVTGEVVDQGHKGEIQVLAFNIGAESTSTIFGKGNSEVSNLSLVKYTDIATPDLVRLTLTGERIKAAQLSFVEIIGGSVQPVVTFQLKDVIVTSHQSGGSGSQDRLTEQIGLNFAAFTYQTFSYSAAGVQTVAPSVTWDIVDNAGSLNDGIPNTVPTLTPIAAQATAEDVPVTVAFTVGDSQTAAGALTLLRSTTNPLVVPLSGITFGGAGSSRNVTLTPAANASGSALVTVTVTDAGGLTASSSFTVTVNPVNDPPLIQALPNQVTNQNTPLNVAIVVSDIDTAAASVHLTPVSGNPGLISAANITFSGSGATTQMILTPATGASGSALVTLTANDGSANSTPVSFTLTVNAATGPTDIQLLGPGNSAPVVNENSPTNTLIGTFTDTDPDSGNVATYQLVDSAGGRFKLAGAALDQLAVDAGTLLDFEAAATHRITVRATDPTLKTFDKVFTITVINVNEAPVITTVPGAVVAEGGSGPVAGLSISDPDSGAANITVAMLVSQGTLHLANSGNLAGKISGNDTAAISVTAPVGDIAAAFASGGLIYSAVGVAASVQTLTIQANDLGHTGIGGAHAAEANLALTVQESRFNQWRQKRFTAAQLEDPALGGPLGDADHDGIANLLEYGVNSNPVNPQSGPGLVEFIWQDVDGITYPAVRFKRLKPALDPALIISAEVATDTFNWRTEPGDTVVVSSTSFDKTLDQVIIRSALPLAKESRQRLRLRFSLVPAVR